MKTLILAMATTLALGVGAASAQTTTVIENDATGAIVLTPQQRTVIRETIVTRPAPSDVQVDVRVGGVVPETVELYAMPRTIVTEVPAYRQYKYFQAGDQVVIVDAGANRIVEIIE